MFKWFYHLKFHLSFIEDKLNLLNNYIYINNDLIIFKNGI